MPLVHYINMILVIRPAWAMPLGELADSFYVATTGNPGANAIRYARFTGPGAIAFPAFSHAPPAQKTISSAYQAGVGKFLFRCAIIFYVCLFHGIPPL